MSIRARWKASGIRWRLANARVRASNAWYRAAGRLVQGWRQQFRNWRNARAIARGRRDAAARAGDAIRSRTPLLRGRVNPATGRPHRDDARLGRLSDQSLARLRRDARSAEANQRHVRGQVARREPSLAQALGAVLRERDEHLRECPQRRPRGRAGRSR